MQQPPGFPYQPLRSSRAIRLLQFLAGPIPTCRMVTVEVEKAPPYVALSYTWGRKTSSRTIRVNDIETPVTVNLAEAIDAIFIFARDRNMMLWADSICINQGDVHERGRQVRLMNTIYRSAEIVAIWLGPAENESELVFHKMKEWKTRYDVLLKLHHGSSLAVTSIASDDPLFFGPCGSEQHRVLEGLRLLYRRAWWSRAWVVQEGTIAHPARTILFCGRSSIDYSSFRASLLITQHVAHYQNFGMGQDFDVQMPLRLDKFREQREKGENIRLLHVLRHIRPYECADPRDKVYAALGMAMDVNENDIIPDYTKSMSVVYTEVVDFCISKSGNNTLDVLGDVFRSAPGTEFEQQHASGLPSWVPDWTLRVSMFPFEKVLGTGTFLEGDKVYRASGSLNGRCYIDGAQLCVQGSILDRIIEVSCVCEWNLATRGLDTERDWIPENASEPYFTGETLMEAFNHTIVADIGSRRGYAIDWECVGQDPQEITAEGRQRQSAMLVVTKMMTFGRRLFKTARGFIGLGPAAAQIDDQVSVLLGGQVLYVLRKQNDRHHEFIGECYVHGMMDGQACENESFLIRDIVLV